MQQYLKEKLFVWGLTFGGGFVSRPYSFILRLDKGTKKYQIPDILQVSLLYFE